MTNSPENICRLDRVDIISALVCICKSIYESFSIEQQNKVRKDIFHHVRIGQYFLFALLEPTGVEIISEINVYLSNSDEQRYIKKLLNKKLPIILGISIFDDLALPQGDICVVGYSRLLDKISAMSISENENQKKLLRHIKSRRKIWRAVYRAVTMDEFLKELGKEHEN